MIAQPYPGGPFYTNPALIAPIGVRALGVPATALPEAQPLLPSLPSTGVLGAGLSTLADPKIPAASFPLMGTPFLQSAGLFPIRPDGVSPFAPALLQPHIGGIGLVPQPLMLPVQFQAGGFLGVPQMPFLKPAVPITSQLGVPLAPGLLQSPLVHNPALAPMPFQQATWPVIPGTANLAPHLQVAPLFC